MADIALDAAVSLNPDTTFKTAGLQIDLRPVEIPDSVEISHAVPENCAKFAGLRAAGTDCDATVLIGETELKAHKELLSLRVPFFAALFNSNMAECASGVVNLNSSCCDSDEVTTAALIDYAYTGRLTITELNVQAVMMGANFLHLSAVMDECARFMRMRLKVSNAIPVLLFCRSMAYDAIDAIVQRFVDKNFVPISATEDFLELEAAEVEALLKRSTLYVDGEQQIFEAAARWLLHGSAGARAKHAARLLACVRTPRLTPAYIGDVMEKHECMKGADAECTDILENAKAFHKTPELVAEKFTDKTMMEARVCDDAHNLIFVVGGLSNVAEPTESKCEVYDPIRDAWLPIKSLPTTRGRAGVAVVDKNVFALGGFDTKNRLNVCEMLDTEDNEWRTLPPMLSIRSAMCTAVVDGVLYALGGYEGSGSLSTVETFRPSEVNPEWRVLGAMSKARGAAAATVLNGKIYVFGGHDSQQIWKDGECYDPVTKSWTALAPMKHKRCRLGLAAYGGKIYAAGGYDGAAFLKDVERYDPETNTWTSMKINKTRRSRATLAVSCGKLFLIGGFDGLNNLSTMDMYQPETDTWEARAPMQNHCGGVFVGVLPVPTTFATPVANLETGDQF